MQSNPFHQIRDGQIAQLPAGDRFPQAGHRWSAQQIDALTFAVAARRPLLVRGEAGCGKSQIARAAAEALKGGLFCEVIHPRFEALDLLYRFDVVERLADAQIQRLGENEKYLRKGALWRAMQAVTRDGTLPVLLIDEIDKADSDVPNALLEVLGNRSFTVQQVDGLTVRASDGRMPLVVITTNEERELPPAFVRRCAVLNLNPPDEDGFESWLLQQGLAHRHLDVTEAARRSAAAQVLEDRKACLRDGYPTVGLAEYMDLLGALDELTREVVGAERERQQLKWLRQLGCYALVKQPGQSQRPPSAGTQPSAGVPGVGG